jgi:SulP family sulfate permease
VLVIRLRSMLSLDSTGVHALELVHQNCRRRGVTLILSGVHVQPTIALFQNGLAERIGEENLFPDFESALARAREIAETEKG